MNAGKERGLLAELAGDRAAAARHFLAAAHLELVLAEDYAQAGADDLALRSRLSAASCFWRAGTGSKKGTQLVSTTMKTLKRSVSPYCFLLLFAC